VTRDAAVVGTRTNRFAQTKEIDVLKITRTETPLEEKWILQGRLVGLWVSELRRTWKKTHRADKNLKCVIDLNEVTFIDVKGERLLRTMSKEGAQLVATGMYIKHVLQQWCAR
jgi:anti-anti-sigma regulatory factor